MELVIVMDMETKKNPSVIIDILLGMGDVNKTSLCQS